MKRTSVILIALLFAACGGSPEDGTANPSPSPAPPPAPAAAAKLAFHLDGAVGIVRLSSDDASAKALTGEYASSSGYAKILADGSLAPFVDAVENFPASSLHVAPDGDLYIAMGSPFDDGEGNCILFRVSSDNSFRCIDRELESIGDDNGVNEWLQFDDAGNLYYSGRDSSWRPLLRRWSEAGGATDLINDNIDLDRFLAMSDGSVSIAGHSSSASNSFLRRLLPDGSLKNIALGIDLSELFALGNEVYYAGNADTGFQDRGVFHIAEDGIDRTMLIGSPEEGSPYSATFDPNDNPYHTCAGAAAKARHGALCYGFGAFTRQLLRTPSGAIYAIDGMGDDSSLLQYFPEVKPIDGSIFRPLIIRNILDELLIAGYDEGMKNRFVIFRPSDGIEIDLLSGEDIEVYHFDYASTGIIYFDGLRFSDNRYVIGAIDTTAGNRLSILSSSAFRYEDLIVFR